MPTTRTRGFTLIELVVTLALVGVVAMVAVPLAELTTTRVKETELRSALRQIRMALDAYKQAGDDGLIPKETGKSGYPPSLSTLVEGVDTEKDGLKRLYFLRQVPRDPFYADQTVPAAEQWNVRAYASTPDEPDAGDDVYDVASLSTRVGLNGIPYSAW